MPPCPWQVARFLLLSPFLPHGSVTLKRDLKKPILPMCKLLPGVVTQAGSFRAEARIVRRQGVAGGRRRPASSCPPWEAILTQPGTCGWRGSWCLCHGYEQWSAGQRELPALGRGALSVALADSSWVNTSTVAFFKLIVEEMGEQAPAQHGHATHRSNRDFLKERS